MKKAIHNYLNRKYYYKNGQLYARLDHDCLIIRDSLIQELRLVFALNEKELKWYIKSWWRKNCKGEFKYWWEQQFPIILMANDLVRVEPLGMPTGRLFYSDFRYYNERVLDNMGVPEDRMGHAADYDGMHLPRLGHDLAIEVRPNMREIVEAMMPVQSIKLPFQMYDLPNRNRRVYPKETLENAIREYTGSTGDLGHPTNDECWRILLNNEE